MIEAGREAVAHALVEEACSEPDTLTEERQVEKAPRVLRDVRAARGERRRVRIGEEPLGLGATSFFGADRGDREGRVGDRPRSNDFCFDR